MCGRFSQPGDLAKLAKRFGIKLQKELPFNRNFRLATEEKPPSGRIVNGEFELLPRYNLAPSQFALAVVLEGREKHFEFMRWGMYRKWGKDQPARFIINLRNEKLAAGPFKDVLPKRRCFLIADGFYEWKPEGKSKQPFRFTMNDNSVFALPAIYDEPGVEEGPSVRTFSIFTTEPNDLVNQVHHRMPAIIPEGLENVWLDPNTKAVDQIVSLLRPYPRENMKSWAVSSAINSGNVEGPELVKPI